LIFASKIKLDSINVTKNIKYSDILIGHIIVNYLFLRKIIGELWFDNKLMKIAPSKAMMDFIINSSLSLLITHQDDRGFSIKQRIYTMFNNYWDIDIVVHDRQFLEFNLNNEVVINKDQLGVLVIIAVSTFHAIEHSVAGLSENYSALTFINFYAGVLSILSGNEMSFTNNMKSIRYSQHIFSPLHKYLNDLKLNPLLLTSRMCFAYKSVIHSIDHSSTARISEYNLTYKNINLNNIIDLFVINNDFLLSRLLHPYIEQIGDIKYEIYDEILI